MTRYPPYVNTLCMSEVSTHHNEGLDLEWDLADRLRKSLRAANVGVGEMGHASLDRIGEVYGERAS